MHALVTGGGGFLGRFIVEQLVARGDRVRSFGRGSYPELEAMGVEVVRGHITDRSAVVAACEGIDCVFHTAARAGVGGTFDDYMQPNVLGTRMVLVGCRAHRVPFLVYTSSPSVAFAGAEQRGVDERARPDLAWLLRNGAHYSRSKALAEAGVWMATYGRGATKSCALRPHLIWGPRDNHLIPRLLARARAGRLWRVGDGTNLIDVTYVENAAAAHLAAADALAAPGDLAQFVYYVSQGEPVNCWQWIDEVLALAGLPTVRKAISHRAARRAGTMCETAYRWLGLKGEPPMTRFLADQLAISHWFDISAARRDLGYEPAVSMAEGMKRLGAWLRRSA